MLYDVKVSSRGPDDEIYDGNLDIRQKVARGNSFIEVLEGPGSGLSCLVGILLFYI